MRLPGRRTVYYCPGLPDGKRICGRYRASRRVHPMGLDSRMSGLHRGGRRMNI